MLRGRARDVSGPPWARGMGPMPPNLVKINYTNLFFTFNTNWKPPSDAAALADAAIHRETCLEVFRDAFNGARLLRWVKDAAGVVPDPTGTVADVKSIKTHFNVEVGQHPKGRRMHVHGLIEIAHTKWLKMNYDQMKNYYNEVYTRRGGLHPIVYIHFRARRRSDKQYMRKYYDVAAGKTVASR